MKLLRVLVLVAMLVFAVAACLPASDRVSSHHDEPFLVCTRQMESGGNYSIDSSNSAYHGAYQFYGPTWNATAQHQGWNYLVGLDPHHASVFEQDEMAWALYQWQGRAPWGGRC